MNKQLSIESQQLKVNLVIQIPEDHVIITRAEFDELKKQELKGVWWTMKDLKNRTGYGYDWLTANILFKPCYKKILDINNGGFVYYPEARGNSWCFQANKMTEFLDTYFKDIFKDLK